MTPQQKNLLILAGALGLGGFIVGWPRLTEHQRNLTIDLVNVGLIGTLIGVPVGLVVLPRTSPAVAATVLTAVSFATKILLLPHEEHPPGLVEAHA